MSIILGMEIFQAIILGIIEGLTEFLPVSSTGHLIVAEELMGYKDTAEIFAIVVQTGAIFAVIWHYRKDLADKLSGLFSQSQSPKAGRFWLNVAVATVPVGLVGFLFEDKITKFTLASVIAWALIAGGILIWLIETYHQAAKNIGEKQQVDKISFLQAVKIGLFQVIALIPGVSRSASTIMGGVLVGLDRVTATAFSFYLSIPILLVVGAYKLISGRDQFETIAGGLPALAVGTAVSFIAALLAIRWLLHYVSNHDFKIFAYYRVILGIIILLVL